jgi:hypothetical protein
VAALGGRIRIGIGDAGPYSVRVTDLRGALVAQASGQGPDRRELVAPGAGLRAVAVKTAKGSFTRLVGGTGL